MFICGIMSKVLWVAHHYKTFSFIIEIPLFVTHIRENYSFLLHEVWVKTPLQHRKIQPHQNLNPGHLVQSQVYTYIDWYLFIIYHLYRHHNVYMYIWVNIKKHFSRKWIKIIKTSSVIYLHTYTYLLYNYHNLFPHRAMITTYGSWIMANRIGNLFIWQGK